MIDITDARKGFSLVLIAGNCTAIGFSYEPASGFWHCRPTWFVAPAVFAIVAVVLAVLDLWHTHDVLLLAYKRDALARAAIGYYYACRRPFGSPQDQTEIAMARAELLRTIADMELTQRIAPAMDELNSSAARSGRYHV